MCRLGSGWDQSTVYIWQGRKAVHDVQWSFSFESSLILFLISCKKTSSRKPSSLKIIIWAFLGLPWNYFLLLLVSAVTLKHVEYKTLKLFCFTKTKFSPSKISREIAGVIITMSWVWLIFRQLGRWEFVDVWKHSGTEVFYLWLELDCSEFLGQPDIWASPNGELCWLVWGILETRAFWRKGKTIHFSPPTILKLRTYWGLCHPIPVRAKLDPQIW